jgi:hypothetical protein
MIKMITLQSVVNTLDDFCLICAEADNHLGEVLVPRARSATITVCAEKTALLAEALEGLMIRGMMDHQIYPV